MLERHPVKRGLSLEKLLLPTRSLGEVTTVSSRCFV